MEIIVSAGTDVGRKRSLNEDRYIVLEKKRLVMVCDGMGGHNAGEVASELAVETIAGFFNKLSEKEVEQICRDVTAGLPAAVKKIIAAIRIANQSILLQAAADVRRKGMGTTLVLLWLDEKYIAAAHVGDSRLYRYRDGQLLQLTHDHSLLCELMEKGEISENEAREFQKKNVITRALGTDQNVKIDLLFDSIQEKDRFLLCSDGLTGPVSDSEISAILGETSTDKIALQRLIDLANQKGGPDNITTALVRVKGKISQPQSPPQKATVALSDEQAIAAIGQMLAMTQSRSSGTKNNKRRTALFLFLLLLFIGALFFCINSLINMQKADHPTILVQEKYALVDILNDIDKHYNDATIFLDGDRKSTLAELPVGRLKVKEGWHTIEIKWRDKTITLRKEFKEGDKFNISIQDSL